MFFIIPWSVDVIQDRYPIVNWLIIVVTIGVFAIQVRDALEEEQRALHPVPYDSHVTSRDVDSGVSSPPQSAPAAPGITDKLLLDGWGLKGLFGHMWLHGGLLHLLGNMWFLWLFGNAVCAKVGNLKYLGLYVLLGVIAGVTHLLFSDGSAVGASGAINGVVGMYLVMFFEHEITCYVFFWFIFFLLRDFAVSSYWMILVWLFWDVLGAFGVTGDSGVAYFAHLGGFGAGFAIAFAMCRSGWITMDRYETSLWDLWQKRRARKDEANDLGSGELQVAVAPQPSPPATQPAKPAVAHAPIGTPRDPPDRSVIGATCSCGKALRVSWQYAGKVVRCPHCGRNISIPGPVGRTGPTRATPNGEPPAKATTLDGYIRLTCSCGRRIKAPARYAGRCGKCPRCGSRIRIPETPG